MALYPVGPLPASTYWRRRGVLLLAFVGLLLLLRSCAGGGPAHKSAAKTAPSPSAPAAPSPTQPVSPPTAVPVCADTALTVKTATDADTYPLGAAPKITLTVANTSSATCRRDLGSGAIELLVFSGDDRVWSSDDCNASKAAAVTTLRPAGTQAVVKTWPGTRSQPGCSGSKAQAKPGTYRVVARVGTLRARGAVFHLNG